MKKQNTQLVEIPHDIEDKIEFLSEKYEIKNKKELLKVAFIVGRDEKNEKQFFKLIRVGCFSRDNILNITHKYNASFAADSDVLYVLYNENNHAIGHTNITITPAKTNDKRDLIYLDSININPEYRDKGNGTILLNIVLNDIQDYEQINDVKTSTWATRLNSKRNNHFYKKFNATEEKHICDGTLTVINFNEKRLTPRNEIYVQDSISNKYANYPPNNTRKNIERSL